MSDSKIDHHNYGPGYTLEILGSVKTIAMVGASADESKASNGVMRFLLDRGYDVVPVNPATTHSEIHGRKVRPSLADVDQPIDMVDVFRPKEELYGLAEQAIGVGASVLWGQLGIYDEAAAELAERAGLKVVMDRCPVIELSAG